MRTMKMNFKIKFIVLILSMTWVQFVNSTRSKSETLSVNAFNVETEYNTTFNTKEKEILEIFKSKLQRVNNWFKHQDNPIIYAHAERIAEEEAQKNEVHHKYMTPVVLNPFQYWDDYIVDHIDSMIMERDSLTSKITEMEQTQSQMRDEEKTMKIKNTRLTLKIEDMELVQSQMQTKEEAWKVLSKRTASNIKEMEHTKSQMEMTMSVQKETARKECETIQTMKVANASLEKTNSILAWIIFGLCIALFIASCIIYSKIYAGNKVQDQVPEETANDPRSTSTTADDPRRTLRTTTDNPRRISTNDSFTIEIHDTSSISSLFGTESRELANTHFRPTSSSHKSSSSNLSFLRKSM